MVKKKITGETRKRQKISPDYDLDRGYSSPLKTVQDLSVENIKSVLIKSRYAQLLLSLTILGAILRFYNLGFNSLWLDEAVTNDTSAKSFGEIWTIISTGDFNPPLFYWMEHVMLLFGNSEFILRFIPAILGMLTIPLFYFIGKELLDRNVGILSAALLAFSSFHIYYSQDARAYTAMLFFASLSILFFLKAIRESDYKNWILFGLFSAIAFWMHFYVIVLIASLLLYALIVQLPSYRESLNTIKPLAIGVITFLALCFPLIILTIQRFASRTESAPTFGAQGFSIIYETFSQMSTFGDIGFYLLVGLFILGMAQFFTIDRKKSLLLLTTLFFTFIISYLLSYKMPMMPRHLIFLLIIFIMGIALSYRFFYMIFRHPAIVYILMGILIIINIPVLVNYYSGYSKEDWRGFSENIQNMTQEGDIIVLVPSYMSLPFNNYYSNTTDETYEYGATTVKDLENISALRGNKKIFFIVTNDIMAVNPNGDEIQWLKENTIFSGQNTGIYLFTAG
jgi:4-amino-4-deoxy-L-arabinose transferase-like glycosyltransferase